MSNTFYEHLVRFHNLLDSHQNSTTFYAYKYNKTELLKEIGEHFQSASKAATEAAAAIGKADNTEYSKSITDYGKNMIAAIEKLKLIFEDRRFWEICDSSSKSKTEETSKNELLTLEQSFRQMKI